VLQHTVLAKSLDKQLEITYTLLFVVFNTTMAVAKSYGTNVILSVQVLVKAVGVKLPKMISTEKMVFLV